jgi:hypothetical protein
MPNHAGSQHRIAAAELGDLLHRSLQVSECTEVRCVCFQLGNSGLLCTGGADATIRVRPACKRCKLMKSCP